MTRTHHSILTTLALVAAIGLTAPAAYAKDKDNNPPGPRGGKGTNWENPKGPVGGPGAGPDHRPFQDTDTNPPGPRGGEGTDWENPAGPVGGPGTGPNRSGHGNGEGHADVLTENPAADTNKDGTIDKVELKKAKKQEANIRFNQWLARHPAGLTNFDANKDGELDKVERKQARKEWKEHKPQRVPDGPASAPTGEVPAE